jgi:threonine/homoserine/homoserine lactone efflux protein
MGQREASRGSLFAAISEGIASQDQSARLQKLEVGLGFLGFYTVVSVGFTLAAILAGKPAVFEAIISALFVFLTWTVFRRWQAAGREVVDEAARRGRSFEG